MLGESPAADGAGAAVPISDAGGSPSTSCIVCDKPLPEMSLKHGDPFCTTRCARAFYGCPLDPATERPLPKAERLAA